MQPAYSRLQVFLHWTVTGLVALDVLLHAPVSEVFRRGRESGDYAATPLVALHLVIGIVVLALVLLRLTLRGRAGQGPLGRLGDWQHWLLYVLLVLGPLAGSLAWGLGSGVLARLHWWCYLLLIWLVCLHVLTVLIASLVLRQNILARMLPGPVKPKNGR